jgi:hypothetical protein
MLHGALWSLQPRVVNTLSSHAPFHSPGLLSNLFQLPRRKNVIEKGPRSGWLRQLYARYDGVNGCICRTISPCQRCTVRMKSMYETRNVIERKNCRRNRREKYTRTSPADRFRNNSHRGNVRGTCEATIADAVPRCLALGAKACEEGSISCPGIS